MNRAVTQQTPWGHGGRAVQQKIDRGVVYCHNIGQMVSPRRSVEQTIDGEGIHHILGAVGAAVAPHRTGWQHDPQRHIVDPLPRLASHRQPALVCPHVVKQRRFQQRLIGRAAENPIGDKGIPVACRRHRVRPGNVHLSRCRGFRRRGFRRRGLCRRGCGRRSTGRDEHRQHHQQRKPFCVLHAISP